MGFSYAESNNLFLIALGWADGIWILLTPGVQKILHINLSLHWAWLGLMGPGLSALLMSYYECKTQGIKTLFKPFLRWKVPFIYYIFVFGGVLLFYCAASYITAALNSSTRIYGIVWLWENTTAPSFHLTGVWVLIEMTIIYAFCEKLGWRGYALPKLVEHINVFYAALILGILWTLWHVPLVYL